MRVDDFPFIADWFAISLRWLTVLGLAIVLAQRGQLTIFLSLILVVLAGWNIYGSGLAVLNRRMPYHRLLNITLDILATLALFWLSHGIHGPITWVGLLALFSSPIYYDVAGSIPICLLISLAMARESSLIEPLRGVNPLLIGTIIFTVSSGIGPALISRKLMSGIRANYIAQVKSREETEQRFKKQEYDRLCAFYNLTATQGY